MQDFTLIDGVVALVIVISALLAYGRGLVRELMAIVGWIVAAIVAFMFAPQVEPLVREVPVIGEFIADSCELSIIGAFAAVFAVALIVVSLFTPLFSGVVQRSALGGIDQGLGFLFGVCSLELAGVVLLLASLGRSGASSVSSRVSLSRVRVGSTVVSSSAKTSVMSLKSQRLNCEK